MGTRSLPPLRAIEAVARSGRLGSARAAAQELGLSPSALSRRVTALEDFVGKKLFTRAHQAMKLTDEGKAFYEAVNPHLEALAAAVGEQSENLQLLRLHLGVAPLFGTRRLFPRMRELRKLHPRLHIDVDTGPNLLARVGDTLDAAIILTTKPDDSFHAVQIDFNLVHASASTALTQDIGDEPDLATLNRQTFLLHSELPESFGAWKKALGLEELEPAAIDHYDSGQLILEAAAQGLGIAIMHDEHFNRAGEGRLAELFHARVESPYSYWYVCRPTAQEQRPLRKFYDSMMAAGL